MSDAEEEEATGYYSLQLHHTERQPNQASYPKRFHGVLLPLGTCSCMHILAYAFSGLR